LRFELLEASEDIGHGYFRFFASSAARSNSETRASTSSISMALAPCVRTSSAARSFVDAAWRVLVQEMVSMVEVMKLDLHASEQDVLAARATRTEGPIPPAFVLEAVGQDFDHHGTVPIDAAQEYPGGRNPARAPTPPAGLGGGCRTLPVRRHLVLQVRIVGTP
jgi:hypothetical protein